MNRDPLHGALDDLIASLEQLLSALENEGLPNDGSLQRAWSACDDAFVRLRDTNDGLADRGVTPEMRERLDHARKLQTVAMSLAQRDCDSVSDELGRLTSLRQRLRKLDARPTTGESCDVHA